MKTKYFMRTAFGDDARRCLLSLANIKVEAASTILSWFEKQCEYPRFDNSTYVELSKLSGCHGKELVECVTTLKVFINRIIDENAGVDEFYADLKSLEIVPPEVGYKTLDVVFLKLGKIVEKYKYYVREKRTSAYGQPTLVSSSMSAALKPVFERKFNYGEDRIEKYVPKSIGYCVIAQVQLKVDTNESYSFQTDMNSFDRFISDLLALQAEMRELETISKNKLL